ncbi:MAG: hypothetical protein ACYSPI_03175, partial [Planctomycetota bacterium]
EPPRSHIQLGDIYMRGERNVLRIPEKDLMRLRCNPFWEYVKRRIEEAITKDKQKVISNSVNTESGQGEDDIKVVSLRFFNDGSHGRQYRDDEDQR